MRFQTMFGYAIGLLTASLVIPVVKDSLANSGSGGMVPAQHAERSTAPVHLATTQQGVGGSVPAKFLGVVQGTCKFFSTQSEAEAESIGKDDLRLAPCRPSITTFVVEWSKLPDQAQQSAWAEVSGDLATNHPDITLAQAAPLISTALQNVQ